MTMKLNKYSDNQILEALNARSDSDSGSVSEEATEKTQNKLHRKRTSKLQTRKENDANVSSDEENIFQNVCYALQKKRILLDKKVSLKIKLRRSTEQSLYKIDTDSECDRQRHKKNGNRILKQSRKSCSDVETEDSYNDSTSETRIRNTKELRDLQIGQEILTHSRIRRPPLRLSSYHCDSLDFLNNVQFAQENSPSLRRRKNINYNEDKLLLRAFETKNRTLKDSGNKNKTPRNSRANKRNHVPLIKDNNTDGSTDVEITKTKSLRKSNESENNENSKANDFIARKEATKNARTNKRNRVSLVKDKTTGEKLVPDSEVIEIIEIIDLTSSRKSNDTENNENGNRNDPIARKETIREEQIVSTPSRVRRQKRVIAKDSQEKGQHIDKTQSDSEEFLIDLYKDIKISSAVKATPTRGDKQKRINSESTQKNVQFVGNDKSNEEEDSLADMYKRIKISSAKKNVSTPQKKNNIRRNIEAQLDGTLSSTPKSRSLKHNNLTPSIGKRHNALLKPATPLQEARSRLHVSAVPKSLPCREEEFNSIFTFLKGKLEDKSGGCIYISGVPGTGKTATVNEAVRCLQKLIIKGQLDDFDYVAINGMKLTEPRQSYVQILKQLDGRTVTWEQAYSILEHRFRRTNSKMTLLLVDELDFLCTKRQDVVYNLLDWPTKTTAHLIVVTIANTMDLPERALMGRVTSRLGLTRLTFQPYNYKQLQEIVMSRLKDFNGFRSEAVQLVSRKVSAVSGDARRALDICRRAMEIAESRNAETISLQDVTAAVSEMIASAKVQAIKCCSKMEQMFLQAVSAEVSRTSIEEVYFKNAYRQLESLCSFDGIKIPTVTETLAICGRLGASRLLICEHSRNDIHQKILLNVSTDDIHYALQELDLNSI
ncbi:origin recognition complex subunit 1 [Megalopta genalis]|uniref:origin recognition complex subunit 1 n=1 Tax=Megalopta genalis TaxID=115081 RepID=UPI003FD25C5D